MTRQLMYFSVALENSHANFKNVNSNKTNAVWNLKDQNAHKTYVAEVTGNK